MNHIKPQMLNKENYSFNQPFPNLTLTSHLLQLLKDSLSSKP